MREKDHLIPDGARDPPLPWGPTLRPSVLPACTSWPRAATAGGAVVWLGLVWRCGRTAGEDGGWFSQACRFKDSAGHYLKPTQLAPWEPVGLLGLLGGPLGEGEGTQLSFEAHRRVQGQEKKVSYQLIMEHASITKIEISLRYYVTYLKTQTETHLGESKLPSPPQ